MKNSQVESLGLVEMSSEEMVLIDAGNPWVIAAAVLGTIYAADYISQQLQIGWNCYK